MSAVFLFSYMSSLCLFSEGMMLKLQILHLKKNKILNLIVRIDLATHHETQQLCEQDVCQHAWWILPAYDGEQQECRTGCLFIPSPLKKERFPQLWCNCSELLGSGDQFRGWTHTRCHCKCNRHYQSPQGWQIHNSWHPPYMMSVILRGVMVANAQHLASAAMNEKKVNTGKVDVFQSSFRHT